MFYSHPRMRQARLTQALFAFLPKYMREAVSFAFFKGGTLVIKLKSHAMKAEFNYKRDLLKSLFRKLKETTTLCGEYELEQIKLYADYEREEEDRKTEFCYRERSSGKFENGAASRAVFDAAERIRSAIKQQVKSGSA